MEYISKYNSPNYDKGNKPKYIVIHHWGADGQNFNAVVNWLCNPKAGVSAHYVVGGNKCACIVAESNVAWHAGNYYYNSHSIGIECRPEMDKETYKTVIETVAMIYKHQKKVLPVIGHKDIVNTKCPGRYYSHLKDIQKQATALYKKGVKPTVSIFVTSILQKFIIFSCTKLFIILSSTTNISCISKKFVPIQTAIIGINSKKFTLTTFTLTAYQSSISIFL